MLKSYKYRLVPTEMQKEKLLRAFGSCRFVYNLGLETKMTAWKSAKKNLTFYDLCKQLTELKNTECLWLNETSTHSLQCSIRNLDRAYLSFFKGLTGFPKFKKKNCRQSIHFCQNPKVRNSRIFLSKIKWVDFIEHRPLPEGKIIETTVSMETTGKYFVSIVIEDGNKVPAKESISHEKSIGIDLGLKTFATLSDGSKIENPKYLAAKIKRLRVEQRKAVRRFKRGSKAQSKGYAKQKLVVSLLYEKIRNKRKDFLHKTSTAIIKQYDTVFVEDINIAGMMHNKKISGSVSDASWHEFLKMLQYKAIWNGKNVVKIGRFDPSSKTCSNCSYIIGELTLDTRIWNCESCGTTHDRDINAAINIKNFGLEAQPATVNEGHKVKRMGCESDAARISPTLLDENYLR